MITFQQKVIAQNGNANSNALGANWKSNGNAATTSDFIGTTNNQSLIFKVYNFERALIDANGDFIIKDPIPITGNLGGGGGRFIISPGTINRTIPTSPIAAYMLKVGGSGFFEGEVNARKLFIEDQITFMKSLKGPRIDVDTIKMDNNKGIYGNTRVFGDVDVKQNLSVAGTITANRMDAVDINVSGDLKVTNFTGASSSLVYADQDGILRLTQQNACNGNIPIVEPIMSEGNNAVPCNLRIGTKDNSSLFLISNGQPRVLIDGGRSMFYDLSGFHSDGSLTINYTAGSSGGTNKLKVNGNSSINGKLGIGTSSPQYQLHLAGETPTIFLEDNVNAAGNALCSFKLQSGNDAGRLISNESILIFLDADNNSADNLKKEFFAVMNNSDHFDNNSKYLFKVNSQGTASALEMVVTLNGFPDYVFSKEYKIKSISAVSEFIQKYKHLPGIPTAKEVEQNGLNLGDMQKMQMEKIEELTLYIIDLQNQINELKKGSQK